MKSTFATLAAAAAFVGRASAMDGDGEGIRIAATAVSSPHGGLADVERDASFRLSVANKSFATMDTFSLLAGESEVYAQLRRDVDAMKTRLAAEWKQTQKAKFGAQQRRLGFNDRVPQVNILDEYYTGSLYFGEVYQELQLIYDTGSDWLVAAGMDCKECAGRVYDYNTSSYFTMINSRKAMKEYGTILHMDGQVVEDQICLNVRNYCVEPFQWFMFSHQYGLPAEVDGLLGLAQGNFPRGTFNMDPDFEVGPLFLDYLRRAGHITEKSFSTHFSNRFGESFIDFGPARRDAMSNINDFVEIQVDSGFFYSLVPEGVRFGTQQSDNIYALKDHPMVLTTGTTFSMVPASLSKNFFKQLLSTVEYYEDNGAFYTNCGEQLQDLWLMLQGYWVQIRGRDLLTDVSERKDNTLCMVNFLPSVDDFWVIGNPLFRDFYVYHSPERGVMGFVPTQNKFKPPLLKADTIDQSRVLTEQYDWTAFWVKFALLLTMAAATWVIIEYVFTTTQSGISFLNAGTHTPSKKSVADKQSVREKLANLDAREVEMLIQKLKAKREAATNNME